MTAVTFATCRPWFHFSKTQIHQAQSSSHLQTDHWSFMQNIEIIHILSSVAVLVQVQDSHSLLIVFLMLISGHIQHIQMTVWCSMYTQHTADNERHLMNRFYCDPISLLAISIKRQIFWGSPCSPLPAVTLRGRLGVLSVPWQRTQGRARQGSGHVALDEGDVAVLALGHRPLLDGLLQDVARQPVRIVQHDGARGAPLLRLHRQQRRLLPSAPLASAPDPLILDSVGTLEGSLGFDASHGTLENAAAKFSSTACLDNLVLLFDAVLLLLASGSSYFQRTEHLLLCFWGNLSKQHFI